MAFAANYIRATAMDASEAEIWLAAIVSSSDDAIVGKRLDSTIVSWNEGATRIFGYTADEMIGQSVLKLFPPELRDEEKSIISRLSRGERVKHYDTTRVRKDGTRIDVSVSVSPIRNKQGEIIGAAKIARDVTETKQMQQALRILNTELEEQANALEAQLEESQAMGTELEETNLQLEDAVDAAQRAKKDADAANRVKSQFLATMSHELRTPLNAIIGYADLMASGVHGPLPPKYAEYLERIRRSQRHLLDLIEGVLDFSKLEAGHMRLEISRVKVSNLFARLEQMVEMMARDKAIQLEVRRPADGVMVRGDPERVMQVLLNLVSNAIKFTPRNGEIVVSADVTSTNHVAMIVRDSGPGISVDDQQRIFEPFVQVDDSLTRTSPGSGLGLAISRELARAMQGDLTVQSAPGRGAVFTLTLDRA